MWMDFETVTQSEVSQKEKNKYRILVHICRIQKNGIDDLICKAEIKTKTREQAHGHQEGKADKLGTGIDMNVC